MLLTLTTTHRPATDLGYLLDKHPERVQAFELAFGRRTSSTRKRPRALHGGAAARRRPIGLARGRRGEGARTTTSTTGPTSRRRSSAWHRAGVGHGPLGPLAGAGRAGGDADSAGGRLPALPCRRGEELLRSPLRAARLRGRGRAPGLDPPSPSGATSPYFSRHAATPRSRSRDLLPHLYVLIPVLDDASTTGSVTTRSRSCSPGRGLAGVASQREQIARRYFRHRPASGARPWSGSSPTRSRPDERRGGRTPRRSNSRRRSA